MKEIEFALIDAAHGADDLRCLTTIADEPLISHVLEELRRSGIRRVGIVTDAKQRPALKGAISSELELTYLEWDGTQQLVGPPSGGPFLVHPGDCLFPDQLSTLAARFRSESTDVAILSGGARAAAVIAAAAWPAFARLPVQALSSREGLATLGTRVDCCDAHERWCYSNTTEQLLVANRMILDRLPKRTLAGDQIDSSRIDGRVRISPTARISGSTVRGPALIGDGAVVEDSFVGPYTTIGAGATVSGAELDYSMVLAGAVIRHPGHRLEASVIEELASVSRSFGLPKGLHVRLGPGSRIMFG